MIIIIIIVVIIVIVVFIDRQSSLDKFGISYSIQTGTTTGSSDVIAMIGNQIYIGQSSIPLTLILNKSSNQDVGRLVGIKNNTGNNITLKGGTIKLDVGQINNTVTVGKTAWLLSTDNTDSWLRLT
uniref:Uncharacterized protein n=1 Tax=Pithovirus LCPAC201 TaxID=2506591 RepID=A0A481Z4H8_9VIRU|nr:MAG: hypothetical protein LCPAC201_00750 [Pithovirus LCPAC201]